MVEVPASRAWMCMAIDRRLHGRMRTTTLAQKWTEVLGARCMMVPMRTTLNVDDDVLLAAKCRAAAEPSDERPFSEWGAPHPNTTKAVTPEMVQELLDESP